MRLKVNGEQRELQATTIALLLQELEMPSIGIAVARNGKVVRRDDHAATPLEENDEIEIIRAVQGG